MFSMSETMLLFGLTAAQDVPLVLYLGERPSLGYVLAVIVGLPLAFLASCLETTLIVCGIHRARTLLKGANPPGPRPDDEGRETSP